MSNALSLVPSASAEQRRDRVLDAATGATHNQREHDLRNQLYLITSFAQLLSEGLAGAMTGRQKELLGHVLDCSRNMQRLMDAARDRTIAQFSLADARAAANS